jgi:Uma2 family endonuclease
MSRHARGESPPPGPGLPRDSHGTRRYTRRMTTAFQRRPATIEEALARKEDEHLELIRGTLVEKAAPTWQHAGSQGGATTTLTHLFQRKGGGGPGGWWFLTELDVRFGSELFRPDICGYRRERVPSPPRERPATIRPDWVCEILSLSNESNDRVEKLETYFRFEVPHYWIINPVEGTLEVFRRTDLAYTLVRPAHRGQRVRAEPFDAVELNVDELLGLDSD